jgi:hypothetical protein
VRGETARRSQMGQATMMKCDELNKLLEESGKLLDQLRGWEDEVKMTPKGDPNYLSKARELKKARGRFNECQKRFRQHIRDHGCR